MQYCFFLFLLRYSHNWCSEALSSIIPSPFEIRHFRCLESARECCFPLCIVAYKIIHAASSGNLEFAGTEQFSKDLAFKNSFCTPVVNMIGGINQESDLGQLLFHVFDFYIINEVLTHLLRISINFYHHFSVL